MRRRPGTERAENGVWRRRKRARENHRSRSSARLSSVVAMSGPQGRGRYQLVRTLATSGMAELHMARVLGEAAERRVVVKRLLPHLAQQAFIVERFVHEARTAARLAHPNIVRVEQIVEGP